MSGKVAQGCLHLYYPTGGRITAPAIVVGKLSQPQFGPGGQEFDYVGAAFLVDYEFGLSLGARGVFIAISQSQLSLWCGTDLTTFLSTVPYFTPMRITFVNNRPL